MERDPRGTARVATVVRTDSSRWMATVIELIALTTALAFAWIHSGGRL